jgi:hypothetical protein
LAKKFSVLQCPCQKLTAYANADGISLDKNLGAAYPVSGIIGVQSMIVPLTDEFIFTLQYKMHEL